MMTREEMGVHDTHCCAIHGCKYGDDDCPVVSGEVGGESSAKSVWMNYVS
jgi:hypothetical protein